jgi:hypothetical protein
MRRFEAASHRGLLHAAAARTDRLVAGESVEKKRVNQIEDPSLPLTLISLNFPKKFG